MLINTFIKKKSVLTYHISATHDGWYSLSLNWCGFLITIPVNKSMSYAIST